jgi:outer membrane lipopolysaccharide assembly protein LptE/RlpB|tara:strand:- start:1708 stop:2160 length:453 start_codon:yes stop_codon:yes gene_type:complete
MIKKYFYLFVFLLFTNCGFTPLYNSNNVNYKINITQISGDNIINTTMMSEIQRISKPSSKNVFNIKINSNYEKRIISKNIKGSASDYQLIATVNFQIIENNKTETINYQEKQNIKKNSNSFDQINYENTIKESFATSFIRKLNLELSSKQ